MWLFALYTFLVATTFVVVLSLGLLGSSLRRGLRLTLMLVLPTWLSANLLFAYAVHRTAYSLEAHDPFCISCHLHEQEFIHFRDESAAVAPDLAGYHQRKGQEFTCITCHVGEGVKGRAAVLFFAGMDVVNYTRGVYDRELTGMKHPLSDTTCTKCHRPGAIQGFHASDKHADYTSDCLTCHLAHAHTDQAFGFMDYDRWSPNVLARCVTCHPALLGQ